MLMYIFNLEVLYYIQIIVSTLVGVLCIIGAFIVFSSDEHYLKNNNKKGNQLVLRGFLMIIAGLFLCFGWYYANKNGVFKHFQEETFGVSNNIIEKRQKKEEISKIKTAEIKKQQIELEKQKLEKKRNKDLEKKTEKESLTK